MKSLLRSRLIKTRFVALLTLGLSATVFGAHPPAVQAGVAPVSIALQVYGDRDEPLEHEALSQASPSSIKGMLFAYHCARVMLEESVAAQDAAYRTYLELSALSEIEITTQFPEGDFRAVLADSIQAYNIRQSQAEIDLSVAEAALSGLTGGETLTDADMIELHNILGL